MTTSIEQPTRQAIAAKDRSAPRKVTGKLRQALLAMVWEGSRRPEAALAAGLKDHSLREALKKPHVKAFYLAELGALRESLRAKNLHRLDGIAESSKNDMARVAAIKTIEQQADDVGGRPAGAQIPGFSIVIITPAAPQSPRAPAVSTPQPVTFDATPAPLAAPPPPELMEQDAAPVELDEDRFDAFGRPRNLLAPRDLAPATKRHWER
jgi:hypothetical protein